MPSQTRLNCKGFTLVEVAIATGILGVLTLIVAALLVQTTSTYKRVSYNTYAFRRADQCLETIASDIRECTDFSLVDPALAPPEASAMDALLLESARKSDGSFGVDGSGFSTAQSLVLFYVNDSPEGIRQLVRHQLYYADDLSMYTPPFALSAAPYADGDIVIVDSFGNTINISRTTGAVGATPSFATPVPVVNGVESFDMVAAGAKALEVNIRYKVVDERNEVTTRLFTKQVQLRN